MQNSFFKNLDYLGYTPNLYIKSKKRYETNTGSFFTILSVISCFGLAAYFILQLVNQKGVNIILNQTNQNSSFLNLTQNPIIISLNSATAKSISNKSIAYIELVQQGVIIKEVNNTKVLEYIHNKIEIEACDINKNFGDYKHLYEDTPQLETYWCPNYNSSSVQNLTIFSKYGDGISGFLFLEAVANKCVNSTKNNNICASIEEINKQLSFVYLGMEVLTNQIDNNNNYNPIQPFRSLTLETLSTQIYKNYITYFDNINYLIDFGYVFEDLNMQIGFIQSNTISDVNLSAPTTLPNSFGSISLTSSNKLNSYFKSFVKLQSVIANIGGMSKFVFF